MTGLEIALTVVSCVLTALLVCVARMASVAIDGWRWALDNSKSLAGDLIASREECQRLQAVNEKHARLN